ncbi:ABC transporter ATP-binding protein [Nonomuraea sp. NPDC049714]|uniref:ABC transporter ATP-binding protein n=1 Tax=Nonomuraea sp. NPDC049714 TaxID=3364357 RepID=UPI0037B8AD29
MTSDILDRAVDPAIDPVLSPPPRIVGFRETVPLLRPYRAQLIGAFFIGLIATGAAAAQPVVVSAIVDAFNGTVPVGLALAMCALLLLSAAATGGRQVIMQRAGERFAFDTRERLVRHIYGVPLDMLESRDRADLVSRVTTDVSQTRTILTSGLVELVGSGITVLVSVVMMALIDPVLLGLAVVAVAAVLVSISLIGRRTRPAGLRLQGAVGDLASSVSRVLGSMKTIRAARSVDREADASVAHAAKALDAGLSAAGLKAVIQTFTGISVQILLIAVVGAGALRVASGALSTGELSAFIMYLMLMAAPMMMFGSIISMLGEAFGALSRILDVESMPIERDVLRPELGAQSEVVDKAIFRLEDVSFRYPQPSADEPDRAALHHVSIAIEEGKSTAIVGPSGAGKSTLFALLERFYEPSSGRILFRGRDVQGLSRDELRAQVAYVDQEAVVLSGSVRENLLLAAPAAGDEQCAEALVQVGLVADRFSASRYLDQEVGELGSRLSGGERQRLAIARAVLARSPILLLDEITSNLDSRNEALVQNVLLSADVARTVLVIAHRFSTVMAADTVIVLDEGRVVAQGPHAELLTRSDLYRELAERQFVTHGAATAG